MKRILVIALVSTVVAAFIFVVLGTGLGYILSDDTIEMARRTGCQGRQRTIYLALQNYRNNEGDLPLDLSLLEQKQYITSDELYCPEPSEDRAIRMYTYFPENFGDANLPLISEHVENHSRGLRLKKLEPVIIQTMGDGQTVVEPIAHQH